MRTVTYVRFGTYNVRRTTYNMSIYDTVQVRGQSPDQNIGIKRNLLFQYSIIIMYFITYVHV